MGKIDRMIGAMRCIGDGAGRELVAWLRRSNLDPRRRRIPGRWRGSGRWRGGRTTGVDADGVWAASGPGPNDEHGLQRSGAKQNGTGGEHEQRQLRSVFVGHGSRDWCCRISIKSATPNPTYLSRRLPPTLDLHFRSAAWLSECAHRLYSLRVTAVRHCCNFVTKCAAKCDALALSFRRFGGRDVEFEGQSCVFMSLRRSSPRLALWAGAFTFTRARSSWLRKRFHR